MINPNPVTFSRGELNCPRCGKEEQVRNQNFCSLCGTYIINRCSGIFDGSFDTDISPFNYRIMTVGETKECPVTFLPKEYRFCPNCGAESTYNLQRIFDAD